MTTKSYMWYSLKIKDCSLYNPLLIKSKILKYQVIFKFFKVKKTKNPKLKNKVKNFTIEIFKYVHNVRLNELFLILRYSLYCG